MGYVIPQDDEEAKQQQQSSWQTPTLGGGAPMQGQAPATQQTPAAQNAQNKGTGFTNLSNWLDAGKGRSAGISSTGSNLLGQEKTNFNNAASGVENANYKAKTVQDVNANGADNFGGQFWKAASGDANAKNDIAGMMNQSYTGPRDVKYDPNAQKNLWDTASLANSDTVGQVLARPQIEQGQYTSGMQRLDNAMYGADAESRAASDKTGADLKAFGADVTTRTKAAADKVAGFDKAAQDANAGTKAELQRIYDTQSGALDRKVQDAKAADDQRRQAIADGYAQDSNGRWHKLQPGEVAGASTGGNATRDTVADQTQRSGFDLLGDLLGTGKLGANTGPYQQVGNTTQKDPNYVAPQERGTPRGGSVYQMLQQSDPAKAKVFMDAWNTYGPKNNGSTLDTQAWTEFYDRFQREHPDVQIPNQSQADAWEKGDGHKAIEAARDDSIPLAMAKEKMREAMANAEKTSPELADYMKKKRGY